MHMHASEGAYAYVLFEPHVESEEACLLNVEGDCFDWPQTRL